MLDVTVNESQIIKDSLEGDYDSSKIIITLSLLIKHYYLGGMNDRLKLREQILNFLKIHYKGYKRAKWEETVTKMVDRLLKAARKNKIEIKVVDISEVKITKQELENIKQLNNINLEKIAFVMLVYAKIANLTISTNEGWINKSCSTICKEAKVNLKGVEKEKIFNDLYTIGYIQQRKHNAKTNMKICYIDNDSEVELTIDDFEGVIYHYLNWKGEKWKKCEGEDCDKWFKIKSAKNTSQKYCDNCKKKKQLEWNNNYRNSQND